MTQSIMIQGTSSNVGKSLLATGLCRIFRQDGFSAAPFKSQNMALNSFITKDGREIGRAQAVQAEAAGIEPSADMNPILLKPTGESTSHVIVNGELVAVMKAAEYFRRKTEFVPAVRSAYARLAAAHDIVVIEGAGSPAEINLKENDIVNMGMAALADAPVLLVGDIDRGGVFASLYGTLALLEPEERARVRGLVINKFRGDAALLRPGLAQLESLTEKPVVGVVPWTRLDIDEEDSASDRFGAAHGGRLDPAKPFDAAVLRLPRIANFTDFAALERHPAFSVRYVESLRELGRPDLLILPGTNNVAADCVWLRENGLAAAVRQHAFVIGVEGGHAILTELSCAARKYGHGLFDDGELANRFAAQLLDGAPAASFDPAAYREEQYDLLADMLRSALDMGAIYTILSKVPPPLRILSLRCKAPPFFSPP